MFDPRATIKKLPGDSGLGSGRTKTDLSFSNWSPFYENVSAEIYGKKHNLVIFKFVNYELMWH
jgi:hypothetical protein